MEQNKKTVDSFIVLKKTEMEKLSEECVIKCSTAQLLWLLLNISHVLIQAPVFVPHLF